MSKCIIIIVMLLCFSLPSAVQNASNMKIDADHRALPDFKSRISSDPLGVLTSWNELILFCQWRGITCGRPHRRLTMLDLGSLELAGSLAPSLGNMSFLRELNIENNSFVGKIPQEIGRLQRLEILSASNNLLGGRIPSNISGCANLCYFNVGYNRIGGRIPEEFGSLSKMKYAYMMRNDLAEPFRLHTGIYRLYR